MRARWAPRSHNAVANDPAARAAFAGEKGAGCAGVCYSTLLLGMTGETVFVFAVVGVTILLFLSGRMRLDLVALMALMALAVSGVITPAEAIGGFSDQAVIMIAALFVVGAAMLETGLAERFGRALGRVAGSGRTRLTAVLMVGTGLLSSFMSTTGTVALMLPVTAALARNAGMSPSMLLMPMSTA